MTRNGIIILVFAVVLGGFACYMMIQDAVTPH